MTVPYAVPPTAVAGQPLAAADWNTKVRDSIESVARPPHVVVYRNTPQLVGNGVVSNVVWLGAAYQSDAFWAAGAPSRVTIPAGLGGLYLVSAIPIWDINGTGGRYATILKNGADQWRTNSGGSAAWYTQHNIVVPIQVVPGDYVELGVYQNSGAALNLKGDIYMMVMTLSRLGV